MRLTLLFILLFPVLSGSGASASHAAFGTQTFHPSAKQQFISGDITRVLGLTSAIDSDTITEFYIIDDNIEDEEDKSNLSFKKYIIPANSPLAFSQISFLSRLHGYYVPAVPVRSGSSCKYIIQRNLRV
ncbi:MAG: hypothetical protein V4557_01165 [Bacteroidota bacterium]